MRSKLFGWMRLGFMFAVTAVSLGMPAAMAQTESFHAIPYLWAAERSAAGEYVFTGYVPTTQLQSFHAVRAGNVVSDTTEIASGAPDDFINISLEALSALSVANVGRASFSGSHWAFVGGVETPEQKQTILELLDGADWQVSVEVTTPEEAQPVVSPYIWRAETSGTGSLKITGNVPTEGMENFLKVRLGDDAVIDVDISVGAPQGFAQDVLAALDVATMLNKGEVGFDGFRWFINGEPQSVDTDFVSTLSSAHTPASAWLMTIEMPAVSNEDIIEETEIEQTVSAASEEVSSTEEAAATVQSEPEADVTSEASAPINPPKLYRFNARKEVEQAIKLSGVVPAAPARSYLGVIAGKVSVDGLYIYEGSPESFLESAIAGVRALAILEEGELLHEKENWTLTGTARTQGKYESVLGMISALSDGESWNINLKTTPPEVLCGEHLEMFASENRILFGAGSARLVKESEDALDELAVYLDECPNVPVHVEGHTDSDGAEEANLTLSVARAEAVVAALIDRSVDPSRLYAVGYGETLPIASNDTRQGRSNNRRIAFKLLNEDQ